MDWAELLEQKACFYSKLVTGFDVFSAFQGERRISGFLSLSL